MFGEFGDCVERVRSGRDRAYGNYAEEANREVDGIGGEDENDVVFLDTQMEKTMGNLGNGGFELREGEDFAGIGVDECGFVWVRRRVSEEKGDRREIGVFGKDERRSQRPENTVTSIPRFLHWICVVSTKEKVAFFLYR